MCRWAILGVLLIAFGASGCRESLAWAGNPDAGTSAEADVLPPAPTLPRSPRLACRKDSDCALVERPCSCRPCGRKWREVLNRRELAKLEAEWARRRCRPPPCRACFGEWLGTKAVCVAGQCAVR